MDGIEFIPGRLYFEDDWHVRVGPYDLTDYCRGDARTIGILADHILLKKFSNMELPPRAMKSGDLIEVHRDGFRIWEVKTTKKDKVNVLQSHAKGVGRKPDQERFENYLDSIAGFILVDQRKLPKVAFCGVTIAQIRERFGKVPNEVPIDFIHAHGTVV